MKKHILSNFKGFLILFFLLIFSHLGWSQDKIIQSKPKDWVLLHSEQEYDVFYKYCNCELPSQGMYKEEVYLKFQNKTNKDIVLNWDLETKYGKKCFNCDGNNPEMHFVLEIPALSSKEGSCNEDAIQKLVVFSRMLDLDYPMILSDFKINNLQLNSVR